MNSFGNDGLRLTWDNHHSTMTEFYKMLHDTNYVADVSICVDGGILRAHRIVMAMCSQYFQDAFRIQTDKEPILIMPDIKFEEMQWLLEYMYRGSIKIERSNLESLMNVAGKLKIKGLFVQNDVAEHTTLPVDSQPKRNEMPPAFEPEMPLTSLHQFQPTLSQANQVQSIFTNALNPSLSYANSIPLHNLVSLSRSLGSQQLIPPFVPNLASPMKSAMPSVSHFNQSERKRPVVKKRKRKPLNDGVESDRSSVSPTDKPETSANIISPIVANNFCDVEPTDLSINKPVEITPYKDKEADCAVQQRSFKHEETPDRLQMLDIANNLEVPRSSAPLVMDFSPENLANNVNIDKEHISQNFTRPESSHSGEFRESGEPSFSSNNSEFDSPSAKKAKRSSLDEAIVNYTDEATRHNIHNDRVETVSTEPIPGPSSIDAIRTQYITAALMSRMPSFLPTADMLHNNDLLTMRQCDNTNGSRRRTTKNGSKNFECVTCERTYASSGNLKRHKKYECGVPPTFCCPKCNKMFQHRHSVKIHVMSSHKDDASLVLEDAEKNPSVLVRSTYETSTVALTDSASINLGIQPPTEAEPPQV